MGNENSQPQNQPFNPNFNLQQYNNKLNQIRSQYNQHNIEAPGAYYSTKTKSETMSCHEITRKVYIFKTTIQIHADGNGAVVLGFQYCCGMEAVLDLGVGVSKIQQHEKTRETINVVCLQSFREVLPPGQKAKFSKTYQFHPNQLKELLRYGIIMKISSGNEYSEYSLTYIPNTKLWKVVVENFSRDGQLFGIEDIYGGGEEGQECIVCFSEKSTTMVKPCNHLCLCSECAKVIQAQSNNCPICRKKIISLVKLTTDQ